MRSTAVKLLKVKPLPASAFPSLRLPPSASPVQSSSAAASSPATRTRSTTSDVTAALQKKIVERQELGDNVRFSEHINKRALYWKVGVFRPFMHAALRTLRRVRYALLECHCHWTFADRCSSSLSLLTITGFQATARRSQEASPRSLILLSIYRLNIVLVPTLSTTLTSTQPRGSTRLGVTSKDQLKGGCD